LRRSFWTGRGDDGGTMHLCHRSLSRTLPADWRGSGLGSDLGQNAYSQIRGGSEIAPNRPRRGWQTICVGQAEDRRQQTNDRGQLGDLAPEYWVTPETLHRSAPFVLRQRAKHQGRRVVQIQILGRHTIRDAPAGATLCVIWMVSVPSAHRSILSGTRHLLVASP